MSDWRIDKDMNMYLKGLEDGKDRSKQEIERLNKECDTYMKIATKRGNIIKEAREYIEYYLTKGKTKNHKQFETSILEILDKGE